MADDPSTIGRYRIVGRLGEGGMAIVYAAEDVDLQRPVAIKTVRDGSAIDRLWREARAAASVNHPNICPIYEIGEHDASCSSRWSASKASRSRRGSSAVR